MSIKLITDRKALEAAIASIATRGKKLDEDVQLAALSTINHNQEHGDITLVNRLYLAMPQGARKAALTAWLLKFGKLSANTDAKTKVEMPFVHDKTKHTDMEGAMGAMWNTFRPDPAPDQVFDVVKALHTLLQRAGKSEAVKGADLLAKLSAIETEYTTEHPQAA